MSLNRRSHSFLRPLPHTAVLVTVLVTSARAQVPEKTPPPVSEQRVQELEAEVRELRTKLDTVLEEIGDRDKAAPVATWPDRLTLGGYGESHANFIQGSDDDFLDNHRFVLYLGYRFADWIQLHSETELEHSFVEDDNGELSLEQLHTDIKLVDPVSVRVGRFLVPVGITNMTHEPTTFYGVERPSLEQFVIPTTWFADGIGLFGQPTEQIGYQAYVCSGLDGSQFDAVDGIREGRQEERPGINEPGFTGRVDFSPSPGQPGRSLRFGLSSFVSGLDNANQGTSGAPGTVQLYSADAQVRCGDVELRGVYAFEHVSDAAELNAMFGNNVAERMQGYYVEAAYHAWPTDWKTGKLEDADAVVFVRYEDFDTQDKMPAGTVADPNGKRQEVTSGLAFFLTSQFVVKSDYQYRDDQPDLFNLGIGWRF